MNFLKKMMGRGREEAEVDESPEMSIEALQRDLDHSGLDRSLTDPVAAWSEKAAQRTVDDDAPELQRLPGHDDSLEPSDTPPDHRTVSRDLEWDDELGENDAEETASGSRALSADDEFAREFSDDGFDEFEEDEFDDEFDELDPEEEQAIRDNALLVDEIRDAIAAVRHIESDERAKSRGPSASASDKSEKGWENDEVFGRKAIARDRLARLSESEDGDRILEETNHKMTDDDAANRRRQAMAHLKAAAAATKADNVLKRVVGRDPAIDPDFQVQYREDLANVVRQRGPRTQPLSRPLSRPTTRPVAAEAAAEAPVSRALSQPVDGFARVDTAPSKPESNPSSAETAMDGEKIDLKTALERQKAILKAEREALEAEIAAEETAEDENEAIYEEADDDLVDEVDFDEEIEPVAEAEAEPQFESEPEEEEEETLLEVATDDGDDWDDGATAARDEKTQDAPVDLTSLGLAAALRAADDANARSEAETPEPALEPVRETEVAETELRIEADDEPEADVAAPSPRRAGRVKTRLLGFQSKTETKDVFAGKSAAGAGPVRFPVGWLVITAGEGFGHSFALLSGVSKIGRGDDQAVQLDFGDTSISRDNHAAIAFDDELNQFFLGHGGKSNVVRLNGTPVLSTEELYDGDEIRIGETTLKFIALCNEEFTWSETAGDDNDHVRTA